VTIGGLVSQVKKAHEQLKPRKIEKGFITLQWCMEKKLKIHGANDYKIPHIGKNALLFATGGLPNKIISSDRALEVFHLVMEEQPGNLDDNNDNDDNNNDQAGEGQLQMI
jgi:hypothetical protein